MERIEAKINRILPEYVRFVMERIESVGGEAYLVGGSLRDMMRGKEPHDFDITTSLLPEETAAAFSDMRVIGTGMKHGTVTVIIDSNPIEITTFRVDGSYTDSRHPDSVSFTRSIEEDLARRDFTVNAIAYSERTGIVDPFFGRADLQNKVLRAVGDAKTRFTEDALRIMRAFRFCAQLEFDIDADTLRGTSESKDGLLMIAKERIASELLRLLTSKDPERALTLMIESGVMEIVTEGYIPTQRIVLQIKNIAPTPSARLGFFLADADEERARQILTALKYSNKQQAGALAVRRGAHTAVRGEKEARRFFAELGDYSNEAIEASYIMGLTDKDTVRAVCSCNAPRKISDLRISGEDLIALGVVGRDIGNVLNELLVLAVDEPSLNDRDRLLALTRDIINNRGIK